MSNPWEKALLIAGAAKPKEMVMTTGSPLNKMTNHKCPRCGNLMGIVKLSSSSDRKILYCTRDRVVLPIPIE